MMKLYNLIWAKFIQIFSNKIIQIFFGLVLILGYLYIRLHKRIPRELTFIYSSYYYYLCIFFILFYCILILICIKINYNKNNETSNSKILLYFPFLIRFINFVKLWIPRIITYIYDCLIEVFQTFFAYYTRSYIGHYIDNFTNLYTYEDNLEEYNKYLYYITSFIPRFIISLMFFLDVCYFHNMKFFYYSLLLLFIPILTRILFYILRDWEEFLCVSIFTHYTVNTISSYDTDPDAELNYTYIFNEQDNIIIPEEFSTNIEALKYLYKQAMKFVYFDSYFYKFSEPLKLKILPYILYLSAWIYTLYKILI